MLAVDDSRSMRGTPLAAAAAAARDFVAHKPRSRPDRRRRVRAAPAHAEHALVRDDRRRHRPARPRRGGTPGHRALRRDRRRGGRAARQPAGRPRPDRARPTAATSRAARRCSRRSTPRAPRTSPIYPIGMEGRGFDPAALEQLAGATGGHYYAAASTDALAGVYGSIAKRLGHTWRMSYVTSARPGDRLRIEASVARAGSAGASLVVPVHRGRRDRQSRTGAAPARTAPTAAAAGSRSARSPARSCSPRRSCCSPRARGSWLRNRLAAHTGGARRTRRRRRDQRSALLSSDPARDGARVRRPAAVAGRPEDARPGRDAAARGGVPLPRRRHRARARRCSPPPSARPRRWSSCVMVDRRARAVLRSSGGGCAAGSASSRTSCPTC